VYFRAEHNVGRTGAVRTKKNFVPQVMCCKRLCCTKVGLDEQRSIFNDFWSLSNYDKQNIYIAGQMSNQDIKRKKTQPLRKICLAAWQYVVKYEGTEFVVCEKFFLKLLQVQKTRLFNLQHKLLDRAPLSDMRGRHLNRRHRVVSDVWALLRMFAK